MMLRHLPRRCRCHAADYADFRYGCRHAADYADVISLC